MPRKGKEPRAQLNCPHCGACESIVLDARGTDQGLGIRRRRECKQCDARYSTYEAHVDPPLADHEQMDLLSRTLTGMAGELVKQLPVSRIKARQQSMQRQIAALHAGAAALRRQ